MHRGFGNAVHIDQPGLFLSVKAEPGFQTRQVERFAAEDDHAERKRASAFDGFGNEMAEGRRRLVQDGDAFILQHVVESGGRVPDIVRNDDHAATMQQRPPDLPDGEVEGDGMEHRPDILGRESAVRRGRIEQAQHIGMADHDPFGLAGGA